MKIIKMFFAAAMASAVFTAAGPAAAAYPDRPIKLLVTTAPGGFADYLARLVADRMSKNLGQSVIVDNRAGANGMIGAESVARATPDGYTIMLGGVDTLVINPAVYTRISYDADKDFVPIGMIAGLPMILASSTTSPEKVESFKELLSKAKQAKGRYTYATWGEGSSGHLAMEMINTPAGLGMVHIPYKGTGPAVNDVVAGVVGLTMVAVQTGEPFFKTGRMRPLAVTSKRRLPGMPDLPTVAEAGFPDYDVSLWYSLMAPRNTPSEVITRLNAALREALAETGFKARMSVSSAPIIGGTPAEARKFIDGDKSKWQQIAKSLNLQQRP